MNHVHFIEKCSCGDVLSQCRCSRIDKIVYIRAGACPKCRQEAIDRHHLLNRQKAVPRRKPVRKPRRLNGTP